MLENNKVYDFRILEANIRETGLGRAFILIKLEEKKSKEILFDRIASTLDKKVDYYGLNRVFYFNIKDEDIQFLIGKECRFRVEESIHKELSYQRVVLVSE